MVYKLLTAARRLSLVRFLRLAMRRLPILPAALCAAIGLPAVTPAWADSPVVIDGADHESRRAVLDLLPDREPPESLFDAERIAEEAAARARERASKHTWSARALMIERMLMAD